MTIEEILRKYNIDNYELYGNDIVKINDNDLDTKKGKLVLVTSINPTPFGEGKTTTSIGLCDSLNKLGVKSIVSLREPSMGPVFGKKGGAVGAGKAKVVPENKINMNFTGDFHAITYANNLISAVIDNHIYQGNELGIDKIIFNRCLDVNDRSLRKVIINGMETSFDITPASEIMSIIGLSESIDDLRINLGNIIIGYNKDNNEIYVKDLNLVDSLLYILEDAFKPNMVKTLYNNPAIIHTGPFANISYGCSSIKSIKLAMKYSDIAITEAGFGSDTGGIKFFDILCRKGKIYPDVVVINTTIKALKYHGNDDITKGICNLDYHIENMSKYTDNIIVSLNKFNDDLVEDINYLKKYLNDKNIKLCISTMYQDGEDGCIDLANEIIKVSNSDKKYEIYNINDPLADKINKMKSMFVANSITFSDDTKDKFLQISKKYSNLPICICKTPYSITDDSKVLGYPKNFDMKITGIKVYNGAGYIVIFMGNVLTMPGLSKDSNYLNFKY